MFHLEVPQGQFELHRYPLRQKETLRAWDAADEYLLQELSQPGAISAETRLVILNDAFGALSTVLGSIVTATPPAMVSDSYLAECATAANLAGNRLRPDTITLLSSLAEIPAPADLVLIKVPKSLALLEDQLCRLRPALQAGTRVIGAGMAKHIHSSTLELFERCIGPTKTSLARKKARLIFATPDLKLTPQSPYPNRYKLEGTDYQISNHAGVFSREKLDIGTRFLLQHLPESGEPLDIIDLGCGNGVVGLIAAERNPQAILHFVDESFMAVASAETNFRAAFGESRQATFEAGDCLSDVAAHSADLILNNPPFHQQQAVGDHIAQQMFKDARRVLRPGGEFWVIGNRHLGYHVKLKRLFGNCELVASNPKFVILKSVKR